jgi:hypothetical protein
LIFGRENRPLTGRTIIKTIRILAAAALACASIAAQAQTAPDYAPTPWRFGFQFGTVQDHNNTEPVAQISMGYEINKTFSVEALGSVSLLFMRMGNMEAGDREFDYAIGGRVLATLPVSEHWNLVGGLGVVKIGDEVGRGPTLEQAGEEKTSPMVSLSAMYRKSRRWSFGLEVSSFTAIHGINGGLRSEYHF